MAMPIQTDGDIEQALAGLTQQQREAALKSEALWRLALEVAGKHPGIDSGDVFHALQCIELTPAERLRRARTRGRLRAYAR